MANLFEAYTPLLLQKPAPPPPVTSGLCYFCSQTGAMRTHLSGEPPFICKDCLAQGYKLPTRKKPLRT